MTRPSSGACDFSFGSACVILVAILWLPAVAAAQTGTVTGTVRNASTLAPLAGIPVYLYSTDIRIDYFAETNAAGFYSIAGVPAGNYFAIAYPPDGSPYLPEVFPETPCPIGCNFNVEFLAGVPFVVTSGGTTSNRNFTLDIGGSVSGRVTNAATGVPLQNVQVSLGARLGTDVFGVFSAVTNASGDYTVTRVPPGSYVAYTANSLGFVNEVYDNIPCVGSCSSSALLAGTAIAVTSGATTSGRDFALNAGGSVTGVVTNAATGAPLQNIQVSLFTVVGTATTSAGSAQTDATGTYTVGGLASGTYYASTSNNLGFINEIYDDLLCPLQCSSTTVTQSGAPIPVTLGATTSGRNFALSQGGNISGTVLDQNTSAPLANVSVSAIVRVGANASSRSASTNAAGNYTITGLPTGTYRLTTFAGQGFINEIYDNQQCRGTCSFETALATGSPVAATAGATATGNNFALQPGGSISGTIVDSTTALPIPGVGVGAYAVVAGVITRVGTASTDSAGLYTITGLHSGTHFVATFGSRPWRNEAYDNVPCIGNTCSNTLIGASTPVPVTLGATAAGRNFALSRGDIVQGQVTDAATGSPLPLVSVTLVHTPSGTTAGQIATGPNGVYSIGGVPNGNYVAFTSNTAGHFNEIYDNIRCTTTCDVNTAVASGTPITVTAAAGEGDGASLVLSRNFALTVRNQPPAAPTNFRASVVSGVAQFSWTEPSTSTAGVATSYVIEAGTAPGGTVLTIPVAGTSHTVNGVPSGVFYVRVRAVNDFGSSPPSTEVVLAVGAGSTARPEAPTAVTAFMSGGRLTMTWAAALSGGPSSSYLVEAGSATGAANIATLPVQTRSFTFVPVPNGFYFLRVRAVNAAGVSPPSAEAMIVVGNVASPPGAPNFSSHDVAGSTVTLSWQAPTVGTATTYIVEAGSAPGLANLAVANTGNANLTASFAGVPPGTYYVRVRAANVLGAGVVSNERTIVVP